MTELASRPEARRGLFITFEGTEGSGKSTQVRLLLERLRAGHFQAVENQEPGGTAIGKEIRRLLLDPAFEGITAMTELMLVFASRAQAAREVVIPALERGAIVVSDRYTDSSLAYQGEGRGLGFDTVLAAHRLALGSLMPDLTICIQVDLETGIARARHRNQRGGSSQDESRIDQHSLAFHRRVSNGYQKIAQLEPERFRMVDGEGSSQMVAERVWAEVAPLLARVSRVTE